MHGYKENDRESEKGGWNGTKIYLTVLYNEQLSFFVFYFLPTLKFINTAVYFSTITALYHIRPRLIK